MAAEARQRGMDVAVTFDEDGHLGEAAIANVGIVDAEGRLCCPEGRRILPGTSMLAARRIAPQRLPVVERPIRREEIFTAREMLLFTSASLCVGISHFEGRPIGQGPDAGRPGPVTPCWNTCWPPARRSSIDQRLLREGAPLRCFDAGRCWCARGPFLQTPIFLFSVRYPGEVVPSWTATARWSTAGELLLYGFSVSPAYGGRANPYRHML